MRGRWVSSRSTSPFGERLWEPETESLFYLIETISSGGRGGIRTHGGLSPTAVFKTAALNHSATLPAGRL